MPRKPSGPRNISSVMYKSQLEPCTLELGYGHDAHEAKFRAMPMTTIMHISFRCEHAKKTVRPQEYIFCDVQKPA